MERGEGFVCRPVRPVGAPGSRYRDTGLTAAKRRKVWRIVVVWRVKCGWEERFGSGSGSCFGPPRPRVDGSIDLLERRFCDKTARGEVFAYGNLYGGVGRFAARRN